MTTRNIEEAQSVPTAYVIKFKVKPGKNAEFETAISDMLAGVREKETGNIYCDVFRLPQDPQAYTIVERFKDAKAGDVHAESEHIKKLQAALKNDLLDGPPEIQDLVFIRSK